jgi:hypothetical protein
MGVDAARLKMLRDYFVIFASSIMFTDRHYSNNAVACHKVWLRTDLCS